MAIVRSVAPGVPPKTEAIVDRAAAGDAAARDHLLVSYRDRLRRVVASRLGSRLKVRVGASDVVQDALIDALRKLSGFLRERPLPFYPWLRRLALERLSKSRRTHLASRRDVRREGVPSSAADGPLPLLRDGRCGRPEDPVERAESRRVIAEAAARLTERQRQILAARYDESLAFREVAARLGISEDAAKVGHFRALEALRRLLDERGRGDARTA